MKTTIRILLALPALGLAAFLFLGAQSSKDKPALDVHESVELTELPADLLSWAYEESNERIVKPVEKADPELEERLMFSRCPTGYHAHFDRELAAKEDGYVYGVLRYTEVCAPKDSHPIRLSVDGKKAEIFFEPMGKFLPTEKWIKLHFVGSNGEEG